MKSPLQPTADDRRGSRNKILQLIIVGRLLLLLLLLLLLFADGCDSRIVSTSRRESNFPSDRIVSM